MADMLGPRWSFPQLVPNLVVIIHHVFKVTTFAPLRGSQNCGPRLHELAALLELVAAPVGGFGLVADAMGERMLAGLMRE